MPLVVPKPDLTPFGTHDCRLEWNSATTIRLVRFGGQWIMISGVRRSIPAGGVIYTTPLVDANKYIFAMWNGSAVYLEQSAATDPIVLDANGMPVHGSNPAATLVGLIWAQISGIDGPRLVCSYWNRRWRSDDSKSGIIATGSTTLVTLAQIAFVSFAGDIVDAQAPGVNYSTSPPNILLSTNLYPDGVSGGFPSNVGTTVVANGYVPFGFRYLYTVPTSGLHRMHLMGAQNAGAGANWVYIFNCRRQA